MKAVVEGLMWGVLMLVVLIVGVQAGQIHTKKAEAAAYQQGWKDALYKRPASDDLEIVCAGLWLSQLKPGEQ